MQVRPTSAWMLSLVTAAGCQLYEDRIVLPAVPVDSLEDPRSIVLAFETGREILPLIFDAAEPRSSIVERAGSIAAMLGSPPAARAWLIGLDYPRTAVTDGPEGVMVAPPGPLRSPLRDAVRLRFDRASSPKYSDDAFEVALEPGGHAFGAWERVPVLPEAVADHAIKQVPERRIPGCVEVIGEEITTEEILHTHDAMILLPDRRLLITGTWVIDVGPPFRGEPRTIVIEDGRARAIEGPAQYLSDGFRASDGTLWFKAFPKNLVRAQVTGDRLEVLETFTSTNTRPGFERDYFRTHTGRSTKSGIEILTVTGSGAVERFDGRRFHLLIPPVENGQEEYRYSKAGFTAQGEGLAIGARGVMSWIRGDTVEEMRLPEPCGRGDLVENIAGLGTVLACAAGLVEGREILVQRAGSAGWERLGGAPINQINDIVPFRSGFFYAGNETVYGQWVPTLDNLGMFCPALDDLRNNTGWDWVVALGEDEVWLGGADRKTSATDQISILRRLRVKTD